MGIGGWGKCPDSPYLLISEILRHSPKLLVKIVQQRLPGERRLTPHCWETNFRLSILFSYIDTPFLKIHIDS